MLTRLVLCRALCRRGAFLGAVLLAAGAAAPGTAAGKGLYTDAELERTRAQMARNIELMVTEDIVGRLPRERRIEAARIRVVFEPRAAHPLLFYAVPATRTVHVPLESLRFFDDLAVLFAWFERKGCDAGHIQSYLHALLRRGQPLPPPLAAFAIDPQTAYADPWVWDVSAKIFNPGILFILAHEVGHLMLGHQPGLSGAGSQAQEMAADAFALDHFAAVGGPPTGADVWFVAARWLDPGDASAALATHPVSPDRLRAVADRLTADPAAFSYSQPDRELGARQVAYIAEQLQIMAALMADPGWVELLPLGLERQYPVSRFAAACPG